MSDATENIENPAAQELADEAAAPEKKASGRFKKTTPRPAQVAKTYFGAVADRDVEGMVRCWASGGVDRIAAIGDLQVPDDLRAFFTQLFAAFPDMRFEVIDTVAQKERVAVRWRSRGTFCGGPFQGIEPTGRRVELEGIDLLTIESGLIRRNDAYYDGTQFARQIGLLPPLNSTAERRMSAAFNARTRIARRFGSLRKERVADGVWVVRGGFPMKTMNVYLIEDDGQVTVFDAGIRAMSRGIAAEAAAMGGIKRVVLGHAHADHRGAAPALDAPIYCHPDDVDDARGDGGEHYFDYGKLEHWYARLAMPRLIRSWDGGPVEIDGTVTEDDEIAGFRVVHLPGHAPGLIGLWRESDRLALASDTLYTLDPQSGRPGPPRVPHRAFNKDTALARESIRKLAALEPEAVWPGHANPVTGNVRQQLERIAVEEP